MCLRGASEFLDEVVNIVRWMYLVLFLFYVVHPESCGCVKESEFLWSLKGRIISICGVNGYLLSELLSHTALHTP